MNDIKIMLLGIAVYFITFKEVITHSVILMIMVGLGWIPTLVVCGDYYDKY